MKELTLRVVADDYDQAQRVRVAKGEQIRAIAQGREQQGAGYLEHLGYTDDLKPDGETVRTSAADKLLAAILRDETSEPSAYLAAAYRAAHAMERRAFDEMGELLTDHPAWPWMGAVRGVGPTLGAKLLSRLDLDLAPNASHFWSYCGLGTVPGQMWRCDACGYVGIHPATHEITGRHKKCRELAVRVAGPDDGVRAAQPRSTRGQRRSYDAFAKKVCYLLASSWLKAGRASFYNAAYRAKVAYYERERLGWERGRIHYSALRHVEKLFLSHLHEAWSVAVGREPVAPYSAARLQHDGVSTAAEVVAWEADARAA